MSTGSRQRRVVNLSRMVLLLAVGAVGACSDSPTAPRSRANYQPAYSRVEEVHPVWAGDALTTSRDVLAGPFISSRERGAPKTVEFAFTIPDRSDYTGSVLVLIEDVSEGGKVASATVALDGTMLWGTSSFPLAGPDSAWVEAGEAGVVEVTLGGKPGTALSITLLGELDPSSQERIVFHSLRDGNFEVYSIGPDGTNETRITADPSFDVWPALSPDGRRIAFTSDRAGAQNIWIVDVDGSTSPTQVTFGPGPHQQPRWSPDGSRLAFFGNEDGDHEIFIHDLESSVTTKVTNNTVLDYGPDWSPNGKRLVFTRMVGGNQDIFVMDPDGSNVSRLTTDAAIDYTPAWSPDGTKIAFSSERVDGIEEVYVMNADGTDQTRLTFSATEAFDPAWSPDGTKIAFGSNQTGVYQVYVLTLASGVAQQITWAAHDSYSPDWR